jgi:hypothetical protein
MIEDNYELCAWLWRLAVYWGVIWACRLSSAARILLSHGLCQRQVMPSRLLLPWRQCRRLSLPVSC